MHIDTEKEGQRLDHCLNAYLPDLSRSQCQRMIKEGCVSLGGTPIYKPSHSVVAQTVYQVTLLDPVPTTLVPENIPLTILYEDEHLLVLDKEAGMVVHPGAGHYEHTLTHALLFHCEGKLSGIGGVCKPGIVHRLDKDTSGLMVVAKTDAAHQGLSLQFSERTLSKLYWAFVWGMPVPVHGLWTESIGRHNHERKKMSASVAHGRSASTAYRLLKTGGGISLLECRPQTGRTHQIRVHCAHHKHPLISDQIYGGKKHPQLQRHALHAKELGFVHPITQKSLHFESPLPNDLTILYNTVFPEASL